MSSREGLAEMIHHLNMSVRCKVDMGGENQHISLNASLIVSAKRFMWLKTTCLDWQETFHTFIRVLNIIVNATRKVKSERGLGIISNTYKYL